MALSVAVRRRHGEAWHGAVRCGVAGRRQLGRIWLVWGDWQGEARYGAAGTVAVRRDAVRHGMAGEARSGASGEDEVDVER